MSDHPKPCEHRHTHPGRCDDCGAVWCETCGTYCARPSPYLCGKKLRERLAEAEQERDSLRRCQDHNVAELIRADGLLGEARSVARNEHLHRLTAHRAEDCKQCDTEVEAHNSQAIGRWDGASAMPEDMLVVAVAREDGGWHCVKCGHGLGMSQSDCLVPCPRCAEDSR